MKTITEYQVQSSTTDDIFDNYQEAKEFFNSMTPANRKKCQFFSKEWNDGQEGEVILYSNFSRDKIE